MRILHWGMKHRTEGAANKRDEHIQKIHERVKYLKRNRELETGYMTMEEYIHEEAGRKAKDMAKDMAQNLAKSTFGDASVYEKQSI